MHISPLQELAVGHNKEFLGKVENQTVTTTKNNSYLLKHVFASVDTNKSSNALYVLSSHGVVKELRFHCRLVLHMRW